MPRLEDMPTPGDLKTVNIEALLSLNPDVAIVTHYAPKDMVNQIVNAGVPVVQVSFYRADYEEASKLNPELKDPDEAYTKGMEDGIQLMGEVFGHPDRADELIHYIFKNRDIVRKHLGDIPPDQRVTCYMANPELHTYGTGKYTGVIMQKAGGRNVAEEIKGYQQVSMEQVLAWNPEVIFVQDRYQSLAPKIKSDPAWATIKAVQKDRVYVCPEYVKPWGHPCPESMALGEIWMAGKLYPDRFEDVDLAGLVEDYYQTFYGISYDGGH
jgi:iron complex transport system substrate-binding protein